MAAHGTVGLPGQKYDFGLVIAAHGSSQRPEAAAHVERIAARIRELDAFSSVNTCFAVGGGSFEKPQPSERGIVIVPFFMSDGGLAEKLTAEITARAVETAPNTTVLHAPPLGTVTEIADFALDLAVAALERTPYEPGESSIVLVAHGSGVRPDSRNDAQIVTDTVTSKGRFAAAALSLLEEPPSLRSVLSEDNGPAVVVGLFAAPGGHATYDVEDEIAAAGRKDVIYAGPVGLHEGMSGLIVATALDAIAKAAP